MHAHCQKLARTRKRVPACSHHFAIPAHVSHQQSQIRYDVVQLFTWLLKSLGVVQNVLTFRRQAIEDSGVNLLLLHQNTNLCVQKEVTDGTLHSPQRGLGPGPPQKREWHCLRKGFFALYMDAACKLSSYSCFLFRNPRRRVEPNGATLISHLAKDWMQHYPQFQFFDF